MTATAHAYIALVGPTASGKSAAAMHVARELRQQWGIEAELISVDSALVYRGMDIGTAKPSLAERAAVTHHLIDMLEPTQSYSAAQFARDARLLIQAVHARRHIPILVGGTMLYFKALFEGLSDLPEADAALRARISQQAQTLGWAAMHAQLAQLDPQTAQRLQPGDSQRIARALEVWHQTGKPLSYWHAHGTRGLPPLPPALLLSLEPVSRAWLHQRIAQRFDAMLAQGFAQEMQQLFERGDLHADLPSMRCVGYRQAWAALANNEPLAQWREKAIAATRQLAKRQLTWLRSMPQRQVIACDAPQPEAQVWATINRFLQTASPFSQSAPSI